MSSLSGMKAICQHMKKSDVTILKLVREEGFPAKKIGGTWESDTELIDRWRRVKIAKGLGLAVNKRDL